MSDHPVLPKDLIPSTSLTEMSWRQEQAWNDEKTVGKGGLFPMILTSIIPRAIRDLLDTYITSG